jgi:hypothetical protein
VDLSFDYQVPSLLQPFALFGHVRVTSPAAFTIAYEGVPLDFDVTATV